MHISYVYIQINVSKKRKKNTIFKYSHDETFATRGNGKVSFHVTGDANAFSRTRFLRVAIRYRWDGHWWLSVKIFIPIHRCENTTHVLALSIEEVARETEAKVRR